MNDGRSLTVTGRNNRTLFYLCAGLMSFRVFPMIMGEMLQDLCEIFSKSLERVYWGEDRWQKDEEREMRRKGKAWGIFGSRQYEEG